MVYIENTGLRDCSGFLQIGSQMYDNGRLFKVDSILTTIVRNSSNVNVV